MHCIHMHMQALKWRTSLRPVFAEHDCRLEEDIGHIYWQVGQQARHSNSGCQFQVTLLWATTYVALAMALKFLTRKRGKTSTVLSKDPKIL